MNHHRTYEDRNDAALALIPPLLRYQGADGIVLAVPRGGVPIGYPIARALNFELDIILSKKIGHPHQKELAVGAVSLLDVTLDPRFQMPKAYIDAEVERIRRQLRENYHHYRGKDAEPVDLKGKTVIIVDDGIATGSTIQATIGLVKNNQPAKTIVAVPVAPPSTVKRLQGLVDEFVCPYTPLDFQAVGQFYRNFTQTEDEEVIALLSEGNRLRGAS